MQVNFELLKKTICSLSTCDSELADVFFILFFLPFFFTPFIDHHDIYFMIPLINPEPHVENCLRTCEGDRPSNYQHLSNFANSCDKEKKGF